MNSVSNAFVVDRMYQLCRKLDETMITTSTAVARSVSQSTLKSVGIELCPSITGGAFGLPASMTTAQVLDAALHTVHDITKSIFNLQYRGQSHSGPFVSRPALDILQNGYEDDMYAEERERERGERERREREAREREREKEAREREREREGVRIESI